MDNHPGEKNFDSIRNKSPAHYDHKRTGVNNEDYKHGGTTGFNLHEGVAGQSDTPDKVVVRPHERAMPARPLPQMPTDALPSMPMPPMTGDTPATFAGIDLQVPPIRKY